MWFIDILLLCGVIRLVSLVYIYRCLLFAVAYLRLWFPACHCCYVFFVLYSPHNLSFSPAALLTFYMLFSPFPCTGADISHISLQLGCFVVLFLLPSPRHHCWDDVASVAMQTPGYVTGPGTGVCVRRRYLIRRHPTSRRSRSRAFCSFSLALSSVASHDLEMSAFDLLFLVRPGGCHWIKSSASHLRPSFSQNPTVCPTPVVCLRQGHKHTQPVRVLLTKWTSHLCL